MSIFSTYSRSRHLAANHFFVLFRRTVGDMDKTHNTNMIENIFVQFCKFSFFDRWRHLAVNHFFVFYGQTVGDMNKTHNTNMIENTGGSATTEARQYSQGVENSN